MKYMVYNKYSDFASDDGLYETAESAKEAVIEMINAGHGDAEHFIVYGISEAFTYVPPADNGTLIRAEIK